VVYHSHLLEHFPKKQANIFIKECYRVLKQVGVLRVVVPDLEQIAQLYLRQLERVRKHADSLNKANYEWAVLEMYDEVVRNYSGGEMGKCLAMPTLINDDWITERMGAEFTSFKNSLLQTRYTVAHRKPSGWKRFLKLSTYRNRLLIWLSNKPQLFELLELARFRNAGEIHQWMYDSYSLGELLREAGFNTVLYTDAFHSNIPNWSTHKWLDVENDKIRKPDSLFMEEIK
jgi:hypothetical protein